MNFVNFKGTFFTNHLKTTASVHTIIQSKRSQAREEQNRTVLYSFITMRSLILVMPHVPPLKSKTFDYANLTWPHKMFKRNFFKNFRMTNNKLNTVCKATICGKLSSSYNK